MGIHEAGCGKKITIRSDATVDHIVPKSYFKRAWKRQQRAAFNQDWNCQPMHGKCNRDRGGQLTGYPRLTCKCHYLQIAGGDLWVHYRTVQSTIRRKALRGVVHEPTAEELERWTQKPPGASRFTVLPVRYSKSQSGYYRHRGGHVYLQIPKIYVNSFNYYELRRVGIRAGSATPVDGWLDAFRANTPLLVRREA